MKTRKAIIIGIMCITIFNACDRNQIDPRGFHRYIQIHNSSNHSIRYFSGILYFVGNAYLIKARSDIQDWFDCYEDFYTQDENITYFFVDGKEWNSYMEEKVDKFDYCVFILQYKDLDRLHWNIYYPDSENEQDIVILFGTYPDSPPSILL